MRIVHIIAGLGVGGAERSLLDLSSKLVDLGNEVAIVCLTGSAAILKQGYDERVRIIRLSLRKNPLYWIAGLVRLSRVTTALDASVIHAHMFHALLVALIWRVLRPQVPLVFTSHSSWISPVRGLMIRLTKRCRSFDIIFSSAQHAQMNAERTVVIPNGTGTKSGRVGRRSGSAEWPWILVAVGRLSPAKAPTQVLEEFAKVDRDNVHLWFVGDGELRAELLATVDRLGIGTRVRVLGVRTDVVSLLDQAHLFVMGSNWEGMPVALLEAGARGVPVLATPVGSIPSLLSNECGYLAERSQFAEMIVSILGDYDEALRRSARLQQRVLCEYSMEAAAAAHLQIYRSLVAIKGPEL